MGEFTVRFTAFLVLLLHGRTLNEYWGTQSRVVYGVLVVLLMSNLCKMEWHDKHYVQQLFSI